MTTRLDGLYDKMTTDERFTVSLSAAARRDVAELARLAASAPRVRYAMLDTTPPAMAIEAVILAQVAERLEHLAWLHQAVIMREQDGDDSPISARLDRAVRMLAYVVVGHADAWRMFAERLGVGPEADALLPASAREVLGLTEATARRVAMNLDEMRQAMGEGDPEAGDAGAERQPVTAEAVADRLEKEYRERLSWWDNR
jgi:hypothetical protein